MRACTKYVIIAAVLAHTIACADHRERVTREGLTEQIVSQSNGALTLLTINKTNGYDHEQDGIKLYTLEWEASIQVLANGWKAGWSDYRVLSARPNALDAAVSGISIKRLVHGGTVTLQGKSALQKADRGWRIFESEVTAAQILLPSSIAALVGTWRTEANTHLFTVKQGTDGELRFVAGIPDAERVRWLETYPVDYAGSSIIVQFAEGNATLTQVPERGVIYTEEGAFGKQSYKVARVQ
jgi:hypothetical protein